MSILIDSLHSIFYKLAIKGAKMYVKYVSHHIGSIVILAVKLDLLKLKIIVNHKINENKIERIEELIQFAICIYN